MTVQSSIPAEVGAVIVNFNAGPYLHRAITSIVSEGVQQFVVVDNASTDRSWEVVPSDALLRNEENVGFARAVNQGARRLAGTNYLLLMNPDACMRAGALQTLVRTLSRHPEAAVIGPRIVDAHGMTTVSARRFPGPMVDLLQILRLTRLVPRTQRQRLIQGPLLPSKGRPVEVDWVSGACMLIRARDWDHLGGLSEEFFLYGEELDWCWRASAAGRKCLYAPEAVVEHVGGVSTATRMSERASAARIREGVCRASRRNMAPLTFRMWLATQRLMQGMR